MTTTLKELCEARGVTIETQLGKAHSPPLWKATKNWRVKLSYQSRALELDYFGGEMVPDPTAADVLGSLLMDVLGMEHAESFEQWAEEFGHDPDSRHAERLYNACKAIQPQLNALLGDDFDLFAEADPE